MNEILIQKGAKSHILTLTLAPRGRDKISGTPMHIYTYILNTFESFRSIPLKV